jgi:hypothetical protein
MQVTIPYKNLTHTLKALKIQIIDSLPYMSDYIPYDINTPRELFTYLKSITKYKNDPQGVELLQSVPTLFERAKYDGKLKGDCDCLVILSTASFIYLGFNNIYVSLVGNKESSPSHIYNEIWDSEERKFMPFDLTNPTYGHERTYNYKQRLKFCI